MIGAPTPIHPLLVGILIDVSGSMRSSIRNASGSSQNRLQSFQSAFGDLAAKARKLSGDQSEDRVKLFAYGFGFGNLLGAIFSSASSPPVRDLLEGARAGSSTIGMNELANDWDQFKSHVEGMAIKMFGATPMLQGIQSAFKRIVDEKQRLSPCGAVLFVLSDGEPTDATPGDVLKAVKSLRDDDTLVVSCYVTDHDITRPRSLYSQPQTGWPDGARLMFDIASTVPDETSFYHYLVEHNWKLQTGARLFTQVNQSEVLAEFLQVIISPLKEISQGQSPTVFVSYSRKDVRWLERLQVHLRPLVREGTVDLWDDTRIQIGQHWQKEIEIALAKAKAAILLVSADFLASDFIASAELPLLLAAAEKRGLKILPVIVGASRFAESAIGKFQAVNSPGKPLSKIRKQDAEELLVRLSRDVKRIIS